MFGAQNKLSMDKEKYKQRLHDLVEQLATQSPELLDYLRKEVNTAISTKTADAFIKLQRKNMRQKGLLFYANIKDAKLKNQLINDYAYMLWYKCIGDIPHMFSYVLFQMENMLNAFIIATPNCYESIKTSPNKYTYSFSNSEQKTPYNIEAKISFIKSDGTNQPLEKISIWGKYAYWFVETMQTEKFKQYTHSLVSDIINLRNTTEHRNSQQEISAHMEKQINYWKTNVETKFSLIDMFISTIRDSIIQLQ